MVECGVPCRFGIKEEWMEFMNAFVSREFDNMRVFLQSISVKHSACDRGLSVVVGWADTAEVQYEWTHPPCCKLFGAMFLHLCAMLRVFLQWLLSFLNDRYCAFFFLQWFDVWLSRTLNFIKIRMWSVHIVSVTTVSRHLAEAHMWVRQKLP